ncbi:MAG: aldo/keto reductase [Janthinobacterium lividum]
MEYRHLGSSGFQVPVLGFGTATFGACGSFAAWSQTDDAGARRLVDICLDAGVTLFDSADVYSKGASETALGHAIKGRRDKVIISTKANLRIGDAPNQVGSSRFHLIAAVDAALTRLGTDYLDIFELHGFDAKTPLAETLSTLDDLVRAGKIRYTGASNFSGWQLQRSLSEAERLRCSRYVVHQVYYSLLHRDYEWELMPLGLDQGVGAMVWSPLAWGRLTGRLVRGEPVPPDSRLAKEAARGPEVSDAHLFQVIGAINDIAAETGKTTSQIALNWLLQRPTVATVLIGARDEHQLRQNLGAVGWKLTSQQIAFLDAASHVRPPYPYWHQHGHCERAPVPV